MFAAAQRLMIADPEVVSKGQPHCACQLHLTEALQTVPA